MGLQRRYGKHDHLDQSANGMISVQGSFDGVLYSDH